MLTPSQTAPTIRVGIYRSSSIGDVVLATACIDLLNQLQVPVQITWIGREPSLSLVQSAFPKIRTMAVQKNATMSDIQGMADELKRLHLLIDLQGNIRSRWLSHRLRKSHDVHVVQADKAQLFRNKLLLQSRLRGRKRPLPKETLQPPQRQYEMMLTALIKGLKEQVPLEMRYDLNEISAVPRLPIEPTLETPWQKELYYGRWVAIAPGAAHPTKQAPEGTFQRVLDNLKALIQNQKDSGIKGTGIVFVGDNRDRQVARNIMGSVHWSGPVLNLAGKLSLYETAKALKYADTLLSNDSALGHIAEAVETPTAIIFGPTVEGFGFGPRKSNSAAFSSLVGCRPCSKHGKATCRYNDRLCFAAVSAEGIAQHIMQLLQTAAAEDGKKPEATATSVDQGPSDSDASKPTLPLDPQSEASV